MICAARVQVGVADQTFWAVWDRERRELHERTRVRAPWSPRRGAGARAGGSELGSEPRRRSRAIDAGEVRVEAPDRRGHRGPSRSARTPEGAYVWTRKRVAPDRGGVSLPGGRRVSASMRGVEDESAGYHPRHTVWSWSAGVGVAADGRGVGWNLVDGVNDPPERSERAIWVEGEDVPREPGPVAFDGLDAIGFDDGSRLEFSNGGRAREAREQARSSAPLPAALRHVQRHPRGNRAARGPRRDGAPRRGLVSPRQPSGTSSRSVLAKSSPTQRSGSPATFATA